MKIRQWLEQMQEPDRSKALENFEELNHEGTDEGLNVDYQYLSEALYNAFVFEDTEEGHDYWLNKWRELKKMGL